MYTRRLAISRPVISFSFTERLVSVRYTGLTQNVTMSYRPLELIDCFVCVIVSPLSLIVKWIRVKSLSVPESPAPARYGTVARRWESRILGYTRYNTRD